MTTATETVKATAAESLKIVRLLDAAAEIQWEASPVPKPREDTTQRAKGGHGDPTGDIVLDPRRLAVREAVVTAEGEILAHLETLRAARVRLEAAIEAWNGE
ncbi:hypothetical protein SEA_KEALII_41 [Arthrobacter phage KeAlii]|uniref:Uncharacterized protein n=1 Tax=Arthrobacter phage KeAlii TaxID=2885973 RepID=A0AA94WSY6_9CAUD|nr:hypothetical protein PQE15_gp41 [Arthrobacter phage KeAlii]UDL14647.1 hypothetical protein SEA_KEALII_41 [Arthrobacter phage KeAlii]